MRTEFFKHDHATDLLTDDQLKALGIISVECSAIEEYVNQLLPVAAGASSESAFVLLGAGTNLGRKLEMLQALATLNFKGKKREHFLLTLRLAQKAINDRSVLLHGVWQHSGNMLKALLSGIPRMPGEAEVINRRKTKQKPVKAVQVLQIATDVSKAHRSVYDLWIKYVISPAIVEGARMTEGARKLINEATGTDD